MLLQLLTQPNGLMITIGWCDTMHAIYLIRWRLLIVWTVFLNIAGRWVIQTKLPQYQLIWDLYTGIYESLKWH